MKRLLDPLVANGFRRGLAGNSMWLVVGAAAWMLRRVRSRRGAVPVWTEELLPGQAVLITHIGNGQLEVGPTGKG